MRKSDVLCGIAAIVIIMLIFGAVGGVDCGRLSLGHCFLYIVGLSLALIADIKIGEHLYYTSKEG